MATTHAHSSEASVTTNHEHQDEQKTKNGAWCFSRQRGLIDGFMQVVQGLEWVKDNFVAPAVVVMALGGKSLQRLYEGGSRLATQAKS